MFNLSQIISSHHAEFSYLEFFKRVAFDTNTDQAST